jgi:adenylate cyclase
MIFLDNSKLNRKPSFLKSRSLQINILIAFVNLLVVTVLFIVIYTYYSNTNTILKLSDDLIRQITETIIEKTTQYLMPASILVEISSRIAEKQTFSSPDIVQFESYTIGALAFYNHPSIYMGDERGNFLGLRKFSDGTIHTQVIDRTVTPTTETVEHRDQVGNVTKVDVSMDVQFDPRVRPWYKGAKETRKQYWTDMYIFFASQKPGITASYPVIDKNGQFVGAFGMDIELEEVSNFLQTQKIGESGITFIVNGKNEIVAYPDLSRIVKKEGEGFRPTYINELGVDWIIDAFHEYEKTGSRKFEFKSNGKRYIGSFTSFPETFGKDWKIGLIVPEDYFLGAIKKTNVISLLISLAILFVAILSARALARSISRPIELLTEETKKIKDLQLNEKVDIQSPVREIQLMSEALSAMKTGLQAFEKYVPAGLVRQLIQTGEEARLGGQKRELTVLFSDVAGFTTISEGMPPEDLMLHLSEYFEELTRIVIAQKGTIDKYIGDAIMAFWGAPIWDVNHAFNACRAALLCQKKLQELNKKWEGSGKISLPTRIGIHTGETVVGNIGSTERMNYSVLGDSVNLANRLEGVNKLYGTQIIVSQATYERVSNNFVFRLLDIVAVKGKKQGIRIYELVCERESDIAQEAEKRCEEFAEGFQAYLRQDWDLALKIFVGIGHKSPADKVAGLYIQRCKEFQKNGTGPDWEGTVYLETK